MLEMVQGISNLAQLHYVRQRSQRIRHAILCKNIY